MKSDPSVLWYLARGTGCVALLLLTASVVLGVANVRRLSTAGLPRFVIDGLHRSVSLLVLAVLAIHVLCSVLDGFAGISIWSALLPFTSAYRPFWLGLGAVALELLLAVAVTSMLRQRIGQRAWRAVHWLAYASWPVAVVHGFGTGSDGRTTWMQALTGVCVLAVLAAVLARLAAGRPADRRRRVALGALTAVSPVLLVVWLLGGPLAAGWARRAGTPAALLARVRPAPSVPSAFAVPFTAQVAGSIRHSTTTAGVVVRIAVADVSGRAIRVRIDGQPTSGGGVAMTGSAVELGTRARPRIFSGQIVGLSGGQITAALTDGRRRIRLDAALRIAGSRVTGSTTVSLAA